jgi:aerobic C4-dicarboxylate transport protein
MSECRALTNFVGNAVATLVVARWEGELDEAQLQRVLSSKEVADIGTVEVEQPVQSV